MSTMMVFGFCPPSPPKVLVFICWVGSGLIAGLGYAVAIRYTRAWGWAPTPVAMDVVAVDGTLF